MGIIFHYCNAMPNKLLNELRMNSIQFTKHVYECVGQAEITAKDRGGNYVEESMSFLYPRKGFELDKRGSR